MRKIVSLLIPGILLAGCNLPSLRDHFNKDEGQEVLSKAKFDRVLVDSIGEMQVYASMNRVTNLNQSANAELQFSDPFKELYLVVIKQTSTSFEDALRDYRNQYVPYVKDSSSSIAIYGDFIAQRNAKNMEGGSDSLLAAKTLHGMQYRAYALSGEYRKIPLFYLMGVYQSSHYLYQVVIWTLAERRNLYEGVMKKMMESLQETSSL